MTASPGVAALVAGQGAHGAQARVPSLHVLLVEDDEGDAFLVHELLLDAGSEVELVRASSLAEAELLLPGALDCVLLDLGLPDATGLDGLRRVLELAPNIAVLVLTGLSDEHRGTAAVAAGAQDYLVKGGIDGQLLTRAVRYAVERKRADESARRLYASEARAAENARLERGLLPRPLLRTGWVRVVSAYRPGGNDSVLGGDFFDVVEQPDGSVFVLVGDVAGHGPDEAALGVCLRIAWRTLMLAGADPHTILGSMHEILVSERSGDEVFATVVMARLRPGEQMMRVWRAGHPVPVVVDGNQALPVPEGDSGPALGVVDGSTWDPVDVPIPAAASLFAFTDGLVEGFAGSFDRDRLGEAGLYRLLTDLLGQGFVAEALVDRLLAAVRDRNGGELTDDVAAVLLSWGGRE